MKYGSEWDGKLYSYIKTTDIVKHSLNIIDLIEVGDVVKVKDNDWVRILYADDKDMLDAIIEDILEKNYKLLSILTKEQYNQNCYKVEE